MNLLLASTSKYRAELLERIGLKFESMAPKCNEDYYKAKGLAPQVLSETLALEKSKSLWTQGRLVLGGDQLAVCEGQILGKPGTAQKAKEMLNFLSDKEHKLYTSICLYDQEEPEIYTDITTIRFRKLTASDIDNYILLDQPLDCAGSYKMEKAGICLVETIKCDDFSAIQGIPLIQLTKMLTKRGFHIPARK